jgi:hypothetical protein
MILKKRLQSVELAQAKRNGDLNYKVVVRKDGESDDEARIRAGMTAQCRLSLSPKWRLVFNKEKWPKRNHQIT